jgi:gluconokinase
MLFAPSASHTRQPRIERPVVASIRATSHGILSAWVEEKSQKEKRRSRRRSERRPAPPAIRRLFRWPTVPGEVIVTATIIVVMGVAGAGKTTIGQLLAAELRCEFVDADSLHPASNIQKMTQGIPLTDADRAPWLAAIHAGIVKSFQLGQTLVVACSALKQRYRDTLADGVPLVWIYLKGSEEVIRTRILQRQDHFMKVQMLASQFADLEEPMDAIVIDVAVAPSVAVRQIVHSLSNIRPQAS